jgi:1,4-alpha-glucan branching enzyme
MQNKLGAPSPLGLSFVDNQVNFSLHAPHATTCAILLFDAKETLIETLSLDKILNKTGSIWHYSTDYARLKGLKYLYLLNDKLHVLDPYAKFLNTSSKW